MKKNRVVLLIVLVIFIFMLSISAIITNMNYDIKNAISSEIKIFLPIILQTQKTHRVGIEIEGANVVSKIGEYYRGDFEKVSFHWSTVEPLPGFYDWSYTDGKIIPDTDLYITVFGSPPWANGTEFNCKLPLPEYWGKFLDWTFAVIERYDPVYLSLWREPDTSYDGADMFFGCIGEDYAAGLAYGEFFNFIYTAVKDEYPDLQIFAGELLDPQQDFFLGMLDAIVAADGISFHHYPRCNTDYSMDRKIQRLRNQTSLPLYMTEGSLIYDTQSLECDQQQVEYFNYLFSQPDIEFFVWYTLGCNGWENADMIYPCNPPHLKPVYQVYVER